MKIRAIHITKDVCVILDFESVEEAKNKNRGLTGFEVVM